MVRTTRTAHAMSRAFNRHRTTHATFAVLVWAPQCETLTALLPSVVARRLVLLDPSVMLSRQEHTPCAVQAARLTPQLSGARGQLYAAMLCAPAQ